MRIDFDEDGVVSWGTRAVYMGVVSLPRRRAWP